MSSSSSSPPRALGAFAAVHLVDSFFWSFTLATRMCLVHSNSVFVVDWCRILTNALWSQPPVCAGRFRIEDFISASSGLGTLLLSLLSLCAEPRRTRAGPLHRQFPVRFSEASVSSLSTKSRKTQKQKSYGGLRKPQRGCGGEPAPPAAWRPGSRGDGRVGLRSRIPHARLGSTGESPPSCHIQCRRGQVTRRVFSSELSRPLGRSLFFIQKSSVTVEASRLWGYLWSTLGPSSHRKYKSLEEASERVKPRVDRLFSRSHVRRWPSWEAIRQRWPRAVATTVET